MDSFLSQPTDHNHAPNPERIPVIELNNKSKARAVISEESTSTILHSSLRTFPLSATSELPRTEMLMQTIRRQRQTPITTSTDRLSGDLRKTYRGEEFLLHEEEHMIIFTTKSNLTALKQSKHWFADGTFKVCPNDFYQLFTLHALMTSTIIPLVYGLLIGKSSNDYSGFFKKVLDQDDFRPETILSDFESGCLFHFGQCVWRQVQSKGLSAKYQEDENFRLNVKMLIGLAFLPLSDVITGFDLVAGEFNDDDADDLLDYFERTWIGEPKRRGVGRKKPQFDIPLWNVYDRVMANLPRSNNSVEGWHNAFANRVTVAHPTMQKLAEKIRCEQSKFEVDIAHLLQGHQPKSKKACHRKLDERIARLVRDYDPLRISQYLKSIAVNVSL
ncbi:unnamed protein product [Rotaria socialis]|uniref:MULE transposase domain-containing protein n=3 Tax=Rotaria socialis TaxID=392032 RepID=A0A818AM60_9BILA|nr:unnamed protein product [Rotaria socialis]